MGCFLREKGAMGGYGFFEIRLCEFAASLDTSKKCFSMVELLIVL
jgi:hypothetical protein